MSYFGVPNIEFQFCQIECDRAWRANRMRKKKPEENWRYIFCIRNWIWNSKPNDMKYIQMREVFDRHEWQGTKISILIWFRCVCVCVSQREVWTKSRMRKNTKKYAHKPLSLHFIIHRNLKRHWKTINVIVVNASKLISYAYRGSADNIFALCAPFCLRLSRLIAIEMQVSTPRQTPISSHLAFSIQNNNQLDRCKIPAIRETYLWQVAHRHHTSRRSCKQND